MIPGTATRPLSNTRGHAFAVETRSPRSDTDPQYGGTLGVDQRAALITQMVGSLGRVSSRCGCLLTVPVDRDLGIVDNRPGDVDRALVRPGDAGERARVEWNWLNFSDVRQYGAHGGLVDDPR
jgi:hypothetical protein